MPQIMSKETESRPKVTPVLGHICDLENDSLMCKIDDKMRMEQPYTKRKILSIVQKTLIHLLPLFSSLNNYYNRVGF